ncbi:MAG: hypothetical protein QM451_07705 [Bacillota bacterium]|jgi:hypothetical protein|nr:hypothetical protein [Bacillota bacterium]HHT91451.1 hypothetical protein [Bacillota bacterium]
MRPTKFNALILVLVLLVSPFLCGAIGHAAFSDIDYNWAKDAILSLEEQGLFEDLWSDLFSPSASLSHEDALTLLTQVFELTAEERDQVEDWLGDLLVAHPEGITRGEFASLLANLLGLGEHLQAPEGFYPSFKDLALDYPGFMGAEFLQRLGLLPTHMSGRFEPYRLITRSEAAFIVHQALQLEEVEGVIAEVEGRQIALKKAAGDETLVMDLLDETLYVSPGSLTRNTINRDEELKKGQNALILARGQQALLVRLEEKSTAQALLEGLNQATQALVDVLTPAQINAIIAGDWELLGEEVSYELYEELVERGVSPWEADALLKRDWASVQMMLQERLTQEAADYLKVAPELVQAALSQDWAKLVEYAQVELAQRLLTSDWLRDATKN